MNSVTWFYPLVGHYNKMTSFETFNWKPNICTLQGLMTGPQLIITSLWNPSLARWSHFQELSTRMSTKPWTKQGGVWHQIDFLQTTLCCFSITLTNFTSVEIGSVHLPWMLISAILFHHIFVWLTVCPARCTMIGRSCNRQLTIAANQWQCCHQECLAGCYGPLDIHCIACIHVTYQGRCMRKCPRGTYEVSWLPFDLVTWHSEWFCVNVCVFKRFTCCTICFHVHVLMLTPNVWCHVLSLHFTYILMCPAVFTDGNFDKICSKYGPWSVRND